MDEKGDINNKAEENYCVNEKQQVIKIDRSAILYEVWTQTPEGSPKVYMLLLHKKSKDWWEQPGGGIEGSDRSNIYIISEALRKLFR